ncbi:MAG: apolipoprotein N-acyltransferase [Gammaproteobacteria bacterium]
MNRYALATPGKYIICLLAGGVLTLAFAPYNYTLAGIVSPLILFWCWDRSSGRQAFWYGYLYGLGLFGTGVNWLHISINLFGGMNLAGALFVTYVLVAFLALYPATTGYLSRKIRSHKTLWLVGTVPALWTLAEWCRSWVFTGFPWLNLGYSQTDTALGAIAPVLGVYGISWLVCIMAALLIMLYQASLAGKFIATAALICIWAASTIMNKVDWTTPYGDEFRVALIQPSIKQSVKWEAEQKQRILDLQMSLTSPYWGHKLIVWPETAIPMFYHQATSVIEELQSLTVEHKTELVTGIPFMDPAGKNYYNSIMVIGGKPDIYHKRHLVPFGEYLPFNRWLRPLLDFIRIPMSDFSAGNSDKPLIRAAGIPIGVSICYEDVFGEEVIEALPEAQILLNVSNDAWFGDSLAPHQHLQMARMRARETGRYLLRSTNNGVSAIIDEKGRVSSQLPQFTPRVLTGTARLFSGTTPYALYGNWVIVSLCLLIVLIAAILIPRVPPMRDKDD